MKKNNVKIKDFPIKLGVEKLNELSFMLEQIGIPNISATNKNTKEYGILLECSCCGEIHCLKSYTYNELISLNLKEEIYNLLIKEDMIFH